MRQTSISLLCLLLLSGCGGSTPTPTTVSVPVAASTPTPTATPNPYAAACGQPLPAIADMYGYGIKVQLEPSSIKKILNANPFVKNPAYCEAVGTPGKFCQTRLETESSRVACDHYMSGISDTGEPGPNWYRVVDGKQYPCGAPGVTPGCQLKPENQYLLDVYLPGKYIACGGKGSNGSCGVCILEEDTYEAPAGNNGNARPGLCQLD